MSLKLLSILMRMFFPVVLSALGVHLNLSMKTRWGSTGGLLRIVALLHRRLPSSYTTSFMTSSRISAHGTDSGAQHAHPSTTREV